MSTVEAPTGGMSNDATDRLVSVTDIAKAFGRTQALRGASFDLRAGEVHVLAGENGSGKSTLVKILSGVYAPDAGRIELGGRTAPALRTPAVAQRNGIATVFQEVLVTEARSVLENVWLGADALFRSRVPATDRRARARATIEELLGRPLDLGRSVEYLSLSDRQACGIVRALLRRPRILILDEATSALDVEVRDRLFKIVRALRDEGAGVIFISHRMDEIREISDRVTVMRSGSTVATLERDQWTSTDLVRLMTGADRLTGHVTTEAARTDPQSRPVVLSARGLVLARGRAACDVSIHAGEVVGVAGLEGHGQHEFLDALRGARPAGGFVIRHRDGREVPIRSPRHAAANSIAYVPRERTHALFQWMSITENFGMPTLSRDARGGWLRPQRTSKRFKTYIERLNIVLGSGRDRITSLSGGNQQKVVIARWLAADPKILLLNDPTRGVDIGTKRELYALLTRLAEEGLAVVMLSTELDEHVELMDRVFVFREHALSRDIPRESLSRATLGSAFFGEQEPSDVGG